MLHNRKTMRNIAYSFAGLLGLLCTAWLVFSLKNVGNAPSKHRIDSIPAILSNDYRPSEKQEIFQVEKALNQADNVVSSAANTDPGYCSKQCDSTLSMLDEDQALDDETFDRLENYAKEIAAYLQNNDAKRQHYLQIALTTTDGDKRSFLTDIFKQLPYQQKVEIGKRFISSESWRVRADGVILIADHDISNFDVTNALMDVFSNEENSYVKSSILTHIKQNSTLRGDAEFLYQLDSAIYSEVDSSVRVAALKAKMRLSEQPYHILPDALHALRTSEPEFQLAGLIAIDQILANKSEYIENGVYIDRNSIKNDVEIIRNMSVYDNDNGRFDRLIREANTIHLRHFEE